MHLNLILPSSDRLSTILWKKIKFYIIAVSSATSKTCDASLQHENQCFQLSAYLMSSYSQSKQFCCKKNLFTKIISEKSKLTKVGNTDNNKQEVVTNDEVSFQLCVLYVFTKGNFLKVLVVEKEEKYHTQKRKIAQ